MFDYAVDLLFDIVCNKFYVIFYLTFWNKSQICSTKIETKDSDKIKCRFRTRVVVGQMSCYRNIRPKVAALRENREKIIQFYRDNKSVAPKPLGVWKFCFAK
jgi:hypothetical protein